MDDLTARVVVLVAALLLAVAAGALFRSRSGRARAVRSGVSVSAAELGSPLGDVATYLQLSSPTCSPCRSVAAVLTALVAERPGLRHVEVDATRRLDLAERLQVLRTPTVLVLDPAGQVVSRFSGPATPAQALAALPGAASAAMAVRP